MTIPRTQRPRPVATVHGDQQQKTDATIARDRELLAQLIGELIADEWLRERDAKQSVALELQTHSKR